MSHVVSPHGWLTIRPLETIWLLEPLVTPPWRAMDVGRHNKTLTAAIVSIQYSTDLEDAFCFHGQDGIERCVVMRRTYSAMTPLAGIAHTLYVNCAKFGKAVPCDLSILLYLAHPYYNPEHAARVFRLTAHVNKKERVKTWDSAFDVSLSDSELESHFAYAFDLLASPRGLKVVYELATNPIGAVRAEAYELGVWTRKPGDTSPEHGRLTLAGALAYLPIAHLMPKLPPCHAWPTAVKPKTCK